MRLPFDRNLSHKLNWIRSGNCPTSEVSALLCAYYDELLTFYADERRGLIALG